MDAQRQFRRRFITAWLCGLFGVSLLLGGLSKAGMMAYNYSQYGLYPIRPDTPTLNLFAITPGNIASVCSGLVISGGLLAVAVVLALKIRRERP